MNTQQPEDNDSPQPDRDATLIPFPTPAGDRVGLGPEVLDGEVLSDEENAAVAGRCLGRGVDRLPPRVVMLVRAVTTSPRTGQLTAVVGYRVRKAPRDLTRLCWFAIRGHGRWITKAWTYTTHGDLRADARAARLAGDQEGRRTAQETIRADSRARWAKVGLALRRGLAGGLLVVFLAGVLALVDSQVDRANMWPWLATVYTVLGVAGVVGMWVLKAVPIGWLVAAVWEGRDHTPGASWLHRPNRADADSWIDERMISQALAHLGIGPLDRFFKGAGELVYTVPARVDGDGTYAQIRLPMGVTADMVAAKRTTLAANLGRAALETWPTQGEEAGVLDLWVADKGKLGAGAGPWPLQDDGTVDVFEGVPLGKSQRGSVIEAPLFESNYLFGGRPGQGKSAVMRTLLLGAALDPTVELWVFVMGQSPDFKPFEPRLSRYAMGMDDAVAEAATAALGDLLREMERRGKLLERQPGSPPKTSRKLADKPGLGLHLLVGAIDECHELFQHPSTASRPRSGPSG
jgi:S-DNA-T family DNA segregation ATPase FtsK/SpoIIIE